MTAVRIAQAGPQPGPTPDGLVVLADDAGHRALHCPPASANSGAFSPARKTATGNTLKMMPGR